jgi:FixJ family two-component response regulator
MSVQTIKAGAQDFLTKPVDENVLLTAVSNALEQHSAVLDEQDRLDDLRRKIDAVTPRELEVLRCVLSGARNKQIGFHLGIAEKTVKVHRGRVMEKLSASSVADLALLCSRVGITPQQLA